MLLPFVKAVIHAWRHAGPVVILDIHGVTDVRKTHDFIPWDDIGQIRLGVGETASYLCFDFKKTDRTREDAPRLGAWACCSNAPGRWATGTSPCACWHAGSPKSCARPA